MENPAAPTGDIDEEEQQLGRFVVQGSNVTVGRSSGSSINKVERVELMNGARERFGQFVARKILGNQNEINVERLAKFNERAKTEFEILLRNRHQNLVEVIGSLEMSEPTSCLSERHLPRFYMKLADFSLRYAITRLDVFPTVSSYTVEHVISWLLQAATGLAFLHSRNIVHRDVKALNMLLYKRGVLLKLCDLEVGRDCQANMTAEQGTELWKAPEVKQVVMINAENKRLAAYGKPADCYSFGRVILELLLRDLPPSDNQMPDWSNSILLAEWSKQSEKDILLELQNLQTALAAQNPDERPDIDAIVTRLSSLGGSDRAPAFDHVSIPEDDMTDTGAQLSLALPAAPVQPPALPAELLQADVIHQKRFRLAYADGTLTDEQLEAAVAILNESEDELITILSAGTRAPLTINDVSVRFQLSSSSGDNSIELCLRSLGGMIARGLTDSNGLQTFLSGEIWPELLLGLLVRPLFCRFRLTPSLLSLRCIG